MDGNHGSHSYYSAPVFACWIAQDSFAKMIVMCWTFPKCNSSGKHIFPIFIRFGIFKHIWNLLTSVSPWPFGTFTRIKTTYFEASLWTQLLCALPVSDAVGKPLPFGPFIALLRWSCHRAVSCFVFDVYFLFSLIQRHRILYFLGYIVSCVLQSDPLSVFSSRSLLLYDSGYYGSLLFHRVFSYFTTSLSIVTKLRKPLKFTLK